MTDENTARAMNLLRTVDQSRSRNWDGMVSGQGSSASAGLVAARVARLVWSRRTWRGWEPKRPPPVTKEDVMALPILLREWLPVSLLEGGEGYSVWRIPREDGNNLVIVSRAEADGSDFWLVSMYVGDAALTASLKKTRSESFAPVASPGKDTGQGISSFTLGGQNGKH